VQQPLWLDSWVREKYFVHFPQGIRIAWHPNLLAIEQGDLVGLSLNMTVAAGRKWCRYLVPSGTLGPVPSIHLSDKVLLIKDVVEQHCVGNNTGTGKPAVFRSRVSQVQVRCWVLPHRGTPCTVPVTRGYLTGLLYMYIYCYIALFFIC
jgi:hypothetical protein